MEPEVRPPSRWRRALPWVSLAWGVTSALIMNREPGRAWLVAVAVLLGWATLVATVVLRRRGPAVAPESTEQTKRRHRVATYSAQAITQSLIQLTVFFVFPLYWASSAGTLGHWTSLAVLAVVGLVTLWDPLFERLLARLPVALTLEALASFAGLLAALPLLGLSYSTSLLLATCGAGLGLPIVAVATGSTPRSARRAMAGVVAALCLAAAVYFGLAAFVPPAPLRLVQGALARDMARAERRPIEPAERFDRPLEKLVCFTAIHAPLGLRERFHHVWSHRPNDPTVTPRPPTRIALPPVEGKKAGAWRTWSFLAFPEAGRWRCDVETETGQVLGRIEAVVD